MLIHCTMDELIAIRDGEGSQAALRHLDECDACRDELDRLHQRVAALKVLPSISPPRNRWPVVRDEIVTERIRKRRQFAGWVSLAAAASLVLALGAGSLVVPTATERSDPIAELVMEAQALEETLRTLRPQLRVVSGRTAGAMAVLEDRISLVEYQFMVARQRRVAREQLVELMRQRVGLMNALVDVHRAPPRYVGF